MRAYKTKWGQWIDLDHILMIHSAEIIDYANGGLCFYVEMMFRDRPLEIGADVWELCRLHPDFENRTMSNDFNLYAKGVLLEERNRLIREWSKNTNGPQSLLDIRVGSE